MKKILIVEDDLTIARIYQGLIRMEGSTAEVARDGEEAMEKLTQFQPDLVLLDVMLPTVNGIEVLKRMRSAPATRGLPVIIFSNAYLSSTDREACQERLTQVLVKSETTPRELLRVIRSTLALETPGSVVDPKPEYSTPPASPNTPVRRSLADPDADDVFQSEVRQTLFTGAPQKLSSMRRALQTISRNASDRDQKLAELYCDVHAISSKATIAGCARLAQIAGALEALLKDLRQRPTVPNVSCLRTIAQAIDLIQLLFGETAKVESGPTGTANIMVVDDEPLSRRAVCTALARANLNHIQIEDPKVALQLLQSNRFDLLFLDVAMPGMTGFELCQALRSGGVNQATPVVFVTGLTDLGSRALSVRSGGNDVIGKPFPPLELIVKALFHILKPQATSQDHPKLNPDSLRLSHLLPAAPVTN
jgi:CheY-like chemotaxis protein